MITATTAPTRREISELVRSRRLTDASPVYATSRLVAFFGGYAGLFLAARAAASPVVWLLAWTVQALVLEGCQIGTHEAAHGNLYRSRLLDYLSGMAWALPVLFCYPSYRSSHLEHHQSTHVTGRDPEPIYPRTSIAEYLGYVLFGGLVFVAMTLSDGLQSAAGRGAEWKHRGRRRALAAVGAGVVLGELALVAVGLATAPRLVAELWLIPFGAYSLFSSVVTHPEHTDCAWGPAPAYLTTRLTRSNPVIRFFLWNINFHPAHHLVPSVPGQKLGELQQAIEPYCAHVSRSYTRWHLGYLVGLLRGDLARPPVDAPEAGAVQLPAVAPAGERPTDPALAATEPAPEAARHPTAARV